jgi:CxxC motif-containing protein (DUF1111 family)
VELGLSNPGQAQNVPHEYVPNEDAEYDINSEQLNALVCFVENLPRPEQILPTDPQQRKIAQRGEQLFASVGCADCHTPNIGGIEGVYSDFRMYDVDDQLRQSGYEKPPKEFELPSSHPRSNEWKTPPLWGVADSAPYYHDGSSPSLYSAIMRHGSHAERSRKKFEKLLHVDQEAVVAFLETLKAPVMPEDDEVVELAAAE